MFLELLLGIGLGVIATGLAARISDTSGAAFGIANHVFTTLFILFRVVGAGVSVAMTQALGAGRRDRADAIARAVVGVSTWMGGIGALAALVAAKPLLLLINAPAEVMPLAVPLLQTLAPALMIDAWNANMASVLRSHLRSREALVVVVVIQAITLASAVFLMPGMGLPGYALACALGRSAGLALHILLWRHRLDLKLRAPDWWQLRRPELAPVFHVGLPGAAENICHRMCFMFSVAAVAKLGAGALATHAYAFSFIGIILLNGLAIGFSVEILVGHMIGAGNLHGANKLVKRALAWGLGITLAVAGSFALFAKPLFGLFTKDPELLKQGAMLLAMTIILEPGRTFNLVVINALRATGDARYPVMAGAASMVLVLAGGSWLFGVYLGWGLVGVFIAYTLDEWIRGISMWHRWVTLRWAPYARASHRKLRRARAH
jgi:putative MATE family efflux protein